MGRMLASITLLLVLLATACARSPVSAPRTGAAVSTSPSDERAVSGSAAWSRPMNVAPLTELTSADSAGGKVPAGEGKFDVISDTPWPGEKVRVFFFGVQG